MNAPSAPALISSLRRAERRFAEVPEPLTGLGAFDDMALPAGKTCGDCSGWLRCKAFIGSLQPTNTRCDWSPSAFHQRAGEQA